MYSAPLVAVLIVIYMAQTGQDWPQFGPAFWMYGASGGLAQILATVATVRLFQARNFAVGITFKKTEVMQAVLVGWVLLGDSVSGWGFAAIGLGIGSQFLAKNRVCTLLVANGTKGELVKDGLYIDHGIQTGRPVVEEINEDTGRGTATSPDTIPGMEFLEGWP